MKKFSIGGWYEKFDQLFSFLNYYYSHREYFYPDREIDSLYDTYCYGGIPLVWAGGRLPSINSINLNKTMNIILNEIDNYPNIKLRHVFTNCLLNDEALLTDYRCNQFIQNYVRAKDEIIVNHPKLIQYLKEYYPYIPLIYSTTMGIVDLNEVNKISKTNLFVLNYNKNNDNDYINQLQYKHNIEILCGEICIDECPYKQIHYVDISQAILDAQLDCSNMNSHCYMDIHPEYVGDQEVITYSLSRKHGISNKRIDELSNIGIKNFKLSGRSFSIPEWLDIILYYLALPEYCSKIRQNLLNEWW